MSGSSNVSAAYIPSAIAYCPI